MKFRLILFLALTFASASFLVAQTETLVGKVVRVADGDTIELQPSEGPQFRVRFQGIDAPELHQPFGMESQRFLKSLINGKTILVKVEKTDRYGRTVGRIWLPRDEEGKRPLDVEEKMLNMGLAWHYSYFNHEKKLARAQENAQNAKRGLWSESNPIPPWKWRKMNPRKN